MWCPPLRYLNDVLTTLIAPFDQIISFHPAFVSLDPVLNHDHPALFIPESGDTVPKDHYIYPNHFLWTCMTVPEKDPRLCYFVLELVSNTDP